MENIDSIVVFEGAKAEATSSTEATGETAATPAEQARDEAGKFKAEAKAETEVKPEAKPEVVTTEAKAEKGQISALLAERGKRQTLEAELQAAREKLAKLEGKPETDIFTDPERVVSDLVSKQLTPIRERFFNQSLKVAAAAHTDFEEVAANFAQMLEADPSLHTRWMESEDPGEFIYATGTNTPEFREKQATQMREQLSTKDSEISALKAKVAELQGAQKAIADVPESLNRQPSGSAPVRGENDSDINNIVRFK